MRSIRLSLGLYFLGLLALALGGASLLVYRSAAATLADKQQATIKLIEARFETRRALEREQLDNRLLERAMALAGRVQIEHDWTAMPYRPLHFLGVFSAGAGPMGHLTAAPWLMQTMTRSTKKDGPPWRASAFAWEVWHHTLVAVKLTENELLLPSGGFDTEPFYQIDSNEPMARPLRSASLEDRSLPIPVGFADGRALHWEADTIELSPGQQVRRVVVKASSARRRFTRPPPPGPERTRPGSKGPSASGPVGPPRPREALHITLQVAVDVSGLNAALDKLIADRDQDFATAREETAADLNQLSRRLLTIAGVTFTATVAGTFWLVWLGLLPLRRLSDAVSKVSPRDFNLGLDGATLPTELTPVADKLRVTLEALKNAFAREKQATADISHELRTPLAAILMTADLALKKERSGPEYREMIQDCQASALQMNQIIERLLTLARLDAGVALFRPQPVDVAEIAEQCAAVVRPLAEASGLTLTVQSHSDPGETKLSTDPDKLREVMNNLLHNAVQYNRPGGHIGLSVVRENGHVRVEVEDTGIGIPVEARGRIFERFFRADPSRRTDGLNAGLGLAIVKEYIELMAGRIDVESEEGCYTRFRVELPVR